MIYIGRPTMPNRHLVDVVDDAVPSWFNKWTIRVIAGALSIGIPWFMTAIYTTASEQLTAQRQQTIAVSKLQDETARLAEAVKDVTLVTKRLVENDVADLKLELAKMQAKGILPAAEKKFETLEASVQRIEATLAKTAPDDVKREVKSCMSELSNRLDRLEQTLSPKDETTYEK